MSRRVVIVGGGVGGATVAAELRAGGFDGEVVLVSADADVPYERPPLSKDLGELEHPAVPHGEDVELLLATRAAELDLRGSQVVLASGRRLRYDALVIATGVRPRRLALDRALYLRTAADARALRAAVAEAEHVAVLGGGLLGAEIAASAATLGRRVTLVSAAPLQRCLGTLVAGALVEIHREHGVEFSRELVSADVLVVACGSEPNDELAAAAGLAVADGVLVDTRCRTAAPGVYALGDVARMCGARFEHHDHAQRQARCVAHDLLGTGADYDAPRWFWSDQFEHTIQAVGVIGDADDVVVRGSLEERRFAVVGLRDGRLQFVIALDRPRDVMDARKVLFSEMTATDVADGSVPLKRLAATATSAR